MKLRLIGMALAAALFAANAQASLIDRGGGLLYDDVLNVTWLQDANYAKTSGYDADGGMNFAAANAWAANLVYGGFDDWRLSSVTDTGTSGCNFALSGTDCGYNVQTVSGSTVYSELAYMYHVNLGLKGYYSASGSYQPDFGVHGNGTTGGEKDFALVQNLQPDAYWSGTAYAPNPASLAWYFGTYDGSQYYYFQHNEFHAWAVRDGDVAAVTPDPAPVPEPGTATLVLAGLGLLGYASRRRRA